jgi:hypothetical protein
VTDERRMTVWHGGCHCGAVRFTVEVDPPVTVQRCNCSICSRTGFVHLIVPAARFTLEQGAALLTEYRFNTGVAKHRFCSRCGVKSFYVPRSNPDGFSVNVNCLDEVPAGSMVFEDFDGRHWEAHAEGLADLSRE